MTSWLLILRIGNGRAGTWSALALGLVGSAAACARPYDAVLLLLPGLLWAARRRRGQALRLGGSRVARRTAAGRRHGGLQHGGERRAVDAALRAAGAVRHGGVRRPAVVPRAEAPLLRALAGPGGARAPLRPELPTWVALGLVLVPCAVAAWRSADPATRMLLASAGLLLAGYAVFWGPWNFSWVWGIGVRVLGPIYAMPLVVPIVLAGLPVLERRRTARPVRWRRWGVVAGVLTVAQLGFALQQAAVDAGRTDRVLAVAQRARARGPLLVDVDPPYLGHPASGIVNDAALVAHMPVPPPGRRTTAPAPPAAQADLRLRRPDLRRHPGAAGRGPGGLTRRDARRRPRERRAGRRAPAGRTAACPLGDGRQLRIDANGASGCDGSAIPRRWQRDVHRRCSDASCLALAVFRLGVEGGPSDLAIPGRHHDPGLDQPGRAARRCRGAGVVRPGVAARRPGLNRHGRVPACAGPSQVLPHVLDHGLQFGLAEPAPEARAWPGGPRPRAAPDRRIGEVADRAPVPQRRAGAARPVLAVANGAVGGEHLLAVDLRSPASPIRRPGGPQAGFGRRQEGRVRAPGGTRAARPPARDRTSSSPSGRSTMATSWRASTPRSRSSLRSGASASSRPEQKSPKTYQPRRRARDRPR